MQKLSQSSFPKGFWGLFSGVCSAVTTDGFGSDEEELLDSIEESRKNMMLVRVEVTDSGTEKEEEEFLA